MPRVVGFRCLAREHGTAKEDSIMCALSPIPELVHDGNPEGAHTSVYRVLARLVGQMTENSTA